MSQRAIIRKRSLALVVLGACGLVSPTQGAEPPDRGTIPTGADGRPLNLDFEKGTLADWTASGEAFAGQPIEGDTVAKRRRDMRSRHAGRFWIGTYEVGGDGPKGTLTSAPFRVTKPFASFLVAGGSRPSTRVEIVGKEDGKVLSTTTGDETEDLKRVAVDLSRWVGSEVFVRLVDEDSRPWGHLNFDDFRLHDEKPDVPARPGPAAPDVFAHAGLDPEAAAEAMTVPEGFRVTLFAGEPDVVQPIALAIDDRGRLWVAEAYSYPIRLPDEKARDRILIFEDTDGDGRHDRRTVFADRLNLVSGLEVGFGGVWVGAAPYLMFIPDRDGDDRPDGPPEILLDGWGQQDTHETLNSFIWGPDGWLYGCHGVFTHSRVGKPGTPDEERIPINAGVWRYHPTKHLFEVFAHGTSNPWGIDFDERGQAIITACVIPHLYHVIQGGRYQRQAGPHFNPYTYDDIKTIGDHVHYLGATPHGGNSRSDAAGGGHAHAGALLYYGGTWPEEYRGSLLMNNIHGARLNRDILEPKGSGFVGRHAPDFLLANDEWSQIVALRTGPDGNVYMIDWYDANQCHRTDPTVHDRTNGRIFKVSYGESKHKPVDLATWDDEKLIGLLTQRDSRGASRFGHPNDWYSRHARRILQERGLDSDARRKLDDLAFNGLMPAVGGSIHGQPTAVWLEDPGRLRALWMLHGTEGLGEEQIARGFTDSSPYIRAWTVQLACEDKNPTSATLNRMAELAKTDPSPVVRLYLASALQRLPLKQRWDILARLVAHAEDADDHNLPLMYWYAAEPLATIDAARALGLATTSAIPILRQYMVRRVGALGTPESLALLVAEIGRHDNSDTQLAILRGLNESLRGRRQVAMPAGWPEVYQRLLQSSDADTREQATELAVTFGDPVALASLRRVLTAGNSEIDTRRAALASLLKARDPELPATLRDLLGDPDLRGPALRGLAEYDDPATPAAILAAYPSLPPAERRDALNTLAARSESAKALLTAVGTRKVPAVDLTADLVRQLRNLDDREVDALIAEHWGSARETGSDKVALIERYRKLLTTKPARKPDVRQGRAVFARVCGQCHRLFDDGSDIGPELTGSNRADLEYILSNVLDPGALIGKDYQAQLVATTDGRILTGLLRSEDAASITLATANETVILPRDEIEAMRTSEESMMPDDLWTPLSDDEVRALVAYLASPAQVPLPPGEPPAASLPVAGSGD